MHLLDCTLRDGGYYNSWNFSPLLISEYLNAIGSARVNVVELGFRFLDNNGFKGPCAFTTDSFLEALDIPLNMTVGVMINASDLCKDLGTLNALRQLFPNPASSSPVELVRMACHFHELPQAFKGAEWLHRKGYRIGINLMQVADRSTSELADLARMASQSPIEVLYFADSMGSMAPDDTSRIVELIREGWSGSLGVHTHDNMGLALSNTLRAQQEGVEWLDSTITGMGRGPGNTRTEELVIEVADLRGEHPNLVPLMALIRKHFASMKQEYGWGTNPYYYLAGKYGIHPTYIQEMLGDSRYEEEDILAVIEHLRHEGGKKFSFNTLDGARQFYSGRPRGSWNPSEIMSGRDVLILGAGPGVVEHRTALEEFIQRERPLVLALNTQSAIETDLIDLRIACHPVRLLADADAHTRLPHPLITPASMLPATLRAELSGKELLDFGLGVEPGRFEFHETHCIAPTALVLAYALSVATSGRAARILMAGFDGYSAGDIRNDEVQSMLSTYFSAAQPEQLISITPTRYKGVSSQSVYGL